MRVEDKKIRRRIISEIDMIELIEMLVEEMKENIIHTNKKSIGDIRGSKKSDPTAQTVINILENKNLSTFEFKLKMFRTVTSNYQDKQIYNKIFKDKKTIEEVSQEMKVSRPTIIKQKEFFIYKMGIAWGIIKVI